VKWYRKAAEQGHADAQFYLGGCYLSGTGVAKDEAEAVDWFRKAAEQGNAYAQYDLGWCYANGAGVAKDYIEAYAWLNLVATWVQEAKELLSKLDGELSPDQIAAGQRRSAELSTTIETRTAR